MDLYVDWLLCEFQNDGSESIMSNGYQLKYEGITMFI